MKNKLVIIGASGHGKVAYEIAALTKKYTEIFYLDDKDRSEAFGEKYLGSTKLFSEMIDDYELFVAVGNSKDRERIMNEYKDADFATLIHPQAIISPSAKIGKGTVIMAGAVVNASTVIGEGVIINTCGSVDHDCNIGDFCHISVGAHLCGTVNIDAHTFICAGATVINNIDICSDCKIGAGSVVVKNIDEAGVYIGVPAKISK